MPDTHTVIRTLSSIVRSIEPAKVALQKRFFDERAKQNGLPNAETGAVQSEKHLAMHTCSAIRNWARRFEIAQGDEDVLMSIVGSVLRISSADYELLSNTPIDEKTANTVLAFFGKSIPRSSPSVSNNAMKSRSEYDNQTFPISTSMEFARNEVHPYYDNGLNVGDSLESTMVSDQYEYNTDQVFENESNIDINSKWKFTQGHPAMTSIQHTPLQSFAQQDNSGDSSYQLPSNTCGYGRFVNHSKYDIRNVQSQANDCWFHSESSTRQDYQGSRDWRSQLQNQFTPMHSGNQTYLRQQGKRRGYEISSNSRFL